MTWQGAERDALWEELKKFFPEPEAEADAPSEAAPEVS